MVEKKAEAKAFYAFPQIELIKVFNISPLRNTAVSQTNNAF